jgi:hypothetical protein
LSGDGLCAPDQDIDLAPQRAAFLAFGRRQLIHRFLVQQPGQVGIGPQMRQLLGNHSAEHRSRPHLAPVL